MTMRIVVTRPQEDSERTAGALRGRGHTVLIAPLMRVEPQPAKLGGGWGGVIVTSANAPAAIADNPARDALVKLPLFAVGRRSAEAARLAGFSDIATAGGDVRDLVRLVVARKADAKAPLIYLAGEDRAADLIGELIARGIAAEMAVVYRAVAAPFPPALTDAYLCDWLRAEAGRCMGHDPKLISISLPYRDCPRHSPAPIRAWRRAAASPPGIAPSSSIPRALPACPRRRISAICGCCS